MLNKKITKITSTLFVSHISLVLFAVHHPNQLLVKFKTGTTSAQKKEVLNQFNASKIKRICNCSSNYTSVKSCACKISRVVLPEGSSLDQIKDILAKHPKVASVEHNHILSIPEARILSVGKTTLKAEIFKAKATSNDQYLSLQWALPKINLTQSKVWNANTGTNIIVAVVDTGVDLNHPDLKQHIIQGYNAVDGNFDPQDQNGHGTHCAGIIGALANNRIGVAGAAPNCKIMPIKVLDASGSGTLDDVAKGIIYAANHGAKVISLSLGGSGTKTLQNAVDYATSKGALCCVAAGNDGVDTPDYPAGYSNSLAVGASDENDKRASFSNYGSWVSVAAPGTNIASTYWDSSAGSTYSYLDGTSMATPYVSGIAAKLFSAKPKATPAQVRGWIQSGSTKIGNWIKYGRIDALASLNLATAPAPTPTPTPKPSKSKSMAIHSNAIHYYSSKSQKGDLNSGTLNLSSFQPINGDQVVEFEITCPVGLDIQNFESINLEVQTGAVPNANGSVSLYDGAKKTFVKLNDFTIGKNSIINIPAPLSNYITAGNVRVMLSCIVRASGPKHAAIPFNLSVQKLALNVTSH